METLMAGFILSLLFSSPSSEASAPEVYDAIIQGGKIVDGTGGPLYHADLGIRDGHISRIGDLKTASAGKRIDASGLVVSPGFIDIHTHADEEIDRLPLAENYLRQGVTTLVGGNCGESIYPVKKRLTALKKLGLGVNFALLVGHSTIRKQVMKMSDRTPTRDEMKKMKALLAKAMEEGAVGISTGLYYAPGSYSKTDEVVELAKVVARYEGIYTSHIRDEGDYSVGVIAAVEEAIEIGEKAGVPVQISHLKAQGRSTWGKSIEVLNLIESARARGRDVTFDQYPYTASSTSLSGAILPRWVQAGGKTRMRQRLLDSLERERIRPEMRELMDKRGGPGNLFVALSAAEAGVEGKSLLEIGRIKGKEPVDAAIDILLAGDAEVISFSMTDEDMLRIMRSSAGMVASDGNLVPFGKGAPHPRYYGTFPRVLGKYVREEGVLALEEAVRKMTSAPACRLGLKDRGLIKEGMVADLILFNPFTVRDRATFRAPHQYPLGVEYVMVNGQIAVSEEKITGVRAGKILSR